MGEGTSRPGFYLRVSIAEACAYRCPYCQPEVPLGLSRPGERLSPVEFAKAVASLAQLGVSRVRLTGGEPLSSPDCIEIIERIAQVETIHDLALTTNGERTEKMAPALRAAGLKRVNVHLDSLRPDRYCEITGGRGLPGILRGIEAALVAGLEPLKINVVLMRGVNDDELFDFCKFALKWGVSVRFIELMNTGPAQNYVRKHFFSAADARERIGERYELTPRFETRGASPAREFALDGGAGTVGFIASESEPFCESCNRLRLTAEGRLKVCLYDPDGLDVRALLRTEGLSGSALLDALAHAIGGKRSHHPAFGETGEYPFSMAGVGG